MIRQAVSLYSYQDAYAWKKMSLEDILREIAGMGVKGIEILSDQMIHGSPNPAPETIDRFRALMDQYQMVSVCNDIFINSTLYRNRRLTFPEQAEMLRAEIINAKNLGFSMIRLVSGTNAEVVKRALDTAIREGVKVGLEIHAGMSFDAPLTAEFCKLMKTDKSGYLGLVFDMGIFCKRHPPIATRYSQQFGLSQGVIDYVDDIFARGTDPARVFPKASDGSHLIPDDAKRLIKNPTDEHYLMFSTGYENTPLSVLDEYLPYLMHIHGKLYEMMPDGEECCIAYPEVIARLKALNWDGYIATEYEGNRFVNLDEPVDCSGQVRQHQAMLARHINA